VQKKLHILKFDPAEGTENFFLSGFLAHKVGKKTAYLKEAPMPLAELRH
jgi:hypothetical protein